MVEFTYLALKDDYKKWKLRTGKSSIGATYHDVFVTHHTERGHMGIAKSIDPGQPAQSAQTDHSRNFSLLTDFLCISVY